MGQRILLQFPEKNIKKTVQDDETGDELHEAFSHLSHPYLNINEIHSFSGFCFQDQDSTYWKLSLSWHIQIYLKKIRNSSNKGRDIGKEQK